MGAPVAHKVVQSHRAPASLDRRAERPAAAGPARPAGTGLGQVVQPTSPTDRTESADSCLPATSTATVE